jgi:hypothetical protein
LQPSFGERNLLKTFSLAFSQIVIKDIITRIEHSTKRPVQDDAAHIEQVGHILAALAILDHLPGMFDLLSGYFRFRPNAKPRLNSQAPLGRGASYYFSLLSALISPVTLLF